MTGATALDISSQGAVGPSALDPPAAVLEDAEVRLGGQIIWRHASFSVRAGSFTAIVGPNGAGKTTLLKVLLGLLPLAQGRVRVLGGLPRRGRADIGYVPQRRTLDADLAVRGHDLVALGVDGHRWGVPLRLGPGAHARDLAVARALDEVGAGAYAGRRLGRLSGGEQQRLLLARAVVSRPRLLLLDEPLGSLDVRNQVAIAQLIGRVGRDRGAAAVMVTHDVNPILRLVDQVVYVAHGQVVAGPPSEVVTTEILSRVYGADVEVLRDSRGRVFVVGLDEEVAHPHEH